MIENKWLMVFLLTLTAFSYAGKPIWTLTPLTETVISVPSNDTAMVQYIVTNQSKKVRTLTMQPIRGITQVTTGLGVCGSPFILTGKASCTLSLLVNGNQLTSPIHDGPIVCEKGSPQQCYRPGAANTLNITPSAAITDATISVTGSPLTLLTNGSAGTLTINNTSLIVAATNITSNFTGTALDGNVTETGNTCASVGPQASCTLTYTPGSMPVPQTNFTIQGSNTNTITAAMQIDVNITINSINPSSGPASGGTGVTLSGTGFTGATGITFDGQPATSVNVINSNTVTAVTPPHAIGSVDVVITTPSGNATQTNGFTYVTTAVGQSAYGGTIACLNGGLANLIAATADNGTQRWGVFGADIPTAVSTTDGQFNTTEIVTALGTGSIYAARTCDDYEIDSQGNTPCQAGNACYNDWFLPAGNNTTPSGQQNCLFVNRVAIGGFSGFAYWSSNQVNAVSGWGQSFTGGGQSGNNKSTSLPFRCVRVFTP